MVHAGYSKEQTDGMMALLVGILYLGQIEFAGDEKASVANMPVLEVAAELWGLEPEGMANALVTYEKQMGSETVKKEQKPSQAKSARDSICKSAFERTFADVRAAAAAAAVAVAAAATPVWSPGGLLPCRRDRTVSPVQRAAFGSHCRRLTLRAALPNPATLRQSTSPRRP